MLSFYCGSVVTKNVLELILTHNGWTLHLLGWEVSLLIELDNRWEMSLLIKPNITFTRIESVLVNRAPASRALVSP